MLFEIILMLELVGFFFLAASVFPYTSSDLGLSGKTSNAPILNKIIFVGIAFILFTALSALTIKYDYNYCYINQTISDFSLNSTISTATCASYQIESTDLSYINMGMAAVSLILFVILMIFAGMARQEAKFEGEM